jgi:organic hydroperoxide reductase OsmC/OhrA
MLWYLGLAAKRGFVVERYTDAATGVLARDATGKEWISTVTLSPEVRYGEGTSPSAAEEKALHHAAHEACFIANSVKTEVTVKLMET